MNVDLDLDVRLGNIPVIFAVSPQGTEGAVLETPTIREYRIKTSGQSRVSQGDGRQGFAV
ncbi:hypothetical protein HY772_10285 [Candidatus Woesearchaeota archaeon]|nr:hypothetical protein [Candidatus Woesearchaeota archaeon]